MDKESADLLWYVFSGAFGTGYFVYGWKQRKVVALSTGIALSVVPYFIDNLAVSIAFGLVCIVLPFVFRV